MEELNKNQLILLVLLVTFVTSIATGIVTVSLMEQAPQSVTQTINRVVTQTIEKVSTSQPATIIRSDSELIAEAAETNTGITAKIALGAGGDVVGQAFIVSDAVLASNVNPALYAEEAIYYASWGKDDVALEFLKFVPLGASGFSLFKVSEAADGKKPALPKAPALGDSDDIRLGQGVFALTAGENLLSGLVSSITREPLATSTPASADQKQPVSAFKTSIQAAAADSGAPVISLSGKVLGMLIVREGAQLAVPANTLRAAVPKQ